MLGGQTLKHVPILSVAKAKKPRVWKKQIMLVRKGAIATEA